MTVNLYNTGVSGLLASQQQLATTGNNIANVNTEGYTRQRAEQNATTGIYSGGNIIGSGTYIEDISRVYDQFSYKEQLLSQTSLSNADSLNVDLGQLDQVMTFSGGAINSSIESFYEAINSISDNPSDLGLRNMAISQAKILSDDLNAINDDLNQMVKSTNGEIVEIADHISDISVQIGNINEQILFSQHSVQGQPNDLLDARDNLVNELSQYTSVNTIVDSLGVMTVMIGDGATLVAGSTSLSVGVQAGDPDPNQTVLSIVGPNSAVYLNGSSVGGALAAKYEFRDEHVAEVQSEMNRIAMAISGTINDAQHSGLDLNNEEGQNFFTDINTPLLEQSRVFASSKNSGNSEATVTITDISKIPTDEFMVEYNGTNYIMTNLTDNSTLDLGTQGSINSNAMDTYGFQFNEESGTPQAGDVFIIKPAHNSAALMGVTLTQASGVAASSAIEVTASNTNKGGASVEITNVSSATDAQQYAIDNNLAVEIYETTSGSFEYRVYNSVTSADIIPAESYVPGSGTTVQIPPSPATAIFEIEVDGLPSGSSAAAPEIFSIADAFGTGNNGNSVALGLTQEQGILNGGKNSFTQGLSISTATVGSAAKSAELTESTAQALFTQAYNRNQSTSGVNLDEEAANLLKYQQAYQAASQIISTANTIFDTLLAAVR
ncbi:flagellar hook-associated protein FlgK [Pseudocolwellia sp. HL-MZ7]|uniref:flagellar hook-associated protein FlgK n=1 Tax=Pseudocolwellia sp. HL-MZ7 TaxID=3400627 RepID=UPI003CEB5CC8